ncbi:unnamed protein product [Cladocopium goreaui]|uniref:Uncharacterized protein n=1 Tax=Cladocopium goreaui TaxID=2562237 RepID=A0A9P1M0I7_9DINO|nr:unnamed protein product [Cladocopium goreaui]
MADIDRIQERGWHVKSVTIVKECQGGEGKGKMLRTPNFVVSGSVKDRWAKGKGTKEDWEGLLHKAHIFVLRSYLALSERDPQIRYVEEATRAFIEAWERGSLEDPIMTQTMLTKVRSLFNSHLHKAFACLDFQSVDDLLAAVLSSVELS